MWQILIDLICCRYWMKEEKCNLHIKRHTRQQSPRAKEGAENHHRAEAAEGSVKSHCAVIPLSDTSWRICLFNRTRTIRGRHVTSADRRERWCTWSLQQKKDQQSLSMKEVRGRWISISTFPLFYLFSFIVTIVSPKICNLYDEINSTN